MTVLKNPKINDVTEEELYLMWLKSDWAKAGYTFDEYMAASIRNGMKITGMSKKELEEFAKMY